MKTQFQHPKYDCAFEVQFMISELEELKEKINDPFILYSGTLSNHLFNIPDYKSNSMTIQRSIRKLLSEISGKQNIWDICESDLFFKDEEWTKWRNEGLTFEAYHKYSLNPKYFDQIVAAINQWISEAKNIFDKMNEVEIQRKKEREEGRAKYSVVEIYTSISPSGGEDGVDGYWDGLIKNNQSEVTMRVVARNVFDFGFYTYPKRVEGTDGVLDWKSWTEEEEEVCKWLSRFSPFTTNIRM